MKTKALLALALALVWAGRAEGGVTIETITEGDGVNFPTVGKSIKVGQLPVRVSAWSCVSPSVKTREACSPALTVRNAECERLIRHDTSDGVL